jgi:hypothetical protein
MNRVTYSLTRRDEGGWTVAVHGARMNFDKLEDALRCANLAARAEAVAGKYALLAIQQDDGTFRTHFPT